MASTLRDLERRIQAIAFVPPVGSVASFELLQGVRVLDPTSRELGSGGFHPNDMYIAMTGAGLTHTIRTHCPQQLRELDLLEKSFQSEHQDAYSMGVSSSEVSEVASILKAPLPASFSTSAKIKGDHKLSSGFELALTPLTGNWYNNNCEDLVKSVLLKYIQTKDDLAFFRDAQPSMTKGIVECGIAFVVKNFTGDISLREVTASVSSGAISASLQAGEGMTVGGSVEGKRKGTRAEHQVTGGVLGVQLLYFRCHKKFGDPLIYASPCVKLTKSNEELLKRVQKLSFARVRRFLPASLQHRHAVQLMDQDYNSKETMAEKISRLSEQAERRSITFSKAKEPGDENSKHTVALHVVDPDYGGIKSFVNSNNMLYTATNKEINSIEASISEGNPTYVVDDDGETVEVNGIKPVLHGFLDDSLPIIYKPEFSGSPDDGCIPSWVLRAESDGDLLMLVQVIGGNDDSRIASMHHKMKWHVRETTVYVKSDDRSRIEDLRELGFIQLDKLEVVREFKGLTPLGQADPELPLDDADHVAAVTDGSEIMMGRHVLALTDFEGNDAPKETKLVALSETASSADPSRGTTFAVGIPASVSGLESEPAHKKLKPGEANG